MCPFFSPWSFYNFSFSLPFLLLNLTYLAVDIYQFRRFYFFKRWSRFLGEVSEWVSVPLESRNVLLAELTTVFLLTAQVIGATVSSTVGGGVSSHFWKIWKSLWLISKPGKGSAVERQADKWAVHSVLHEQYKTWKTCPGTYVKWGFLKQWLHILKQYDLGVFWKPCLVTQKLIVILEG